MNHESPDSEHFSWADFDRLDELREDVVDIEQAQIPDGTYRQIKNLHEALVAKARLLMEVENRLAEQVADFERQKRQFDDRRIAAGQFKTESRLSVLIQHDKVELTTDTSIEQPVGIPGESQIKDDEIDFVEVAERADTRIDEDSELEEVFDYDAVNEILADADVASTQDPSALHDDWGRQAETNAIFELEPVPPNDTEPSLNSLPEDQTANSDEQQASFRLKNSAKLLREKSEFLSAVFVELDQMVRDLDRQQKLLEQIRVGNSSQSTTEFQEVSDKVKKRFHRISRQIHTTA